MILNMNPEDIKYVKILYQDSEEKACSVRAAIRSITKTEIMCCAKFEDGLHIKTPQDVTFSIVCTEGLYRTKTVLRKVENDEPYTFFFLIPPASLEYRQNREYFRVALALKCVFSYKLNDEIINIQTQTADISASGVSVILPQCEIGSEDAWLSITVNNRQVKTKVKYIRDEKIDSEYKISFRFTEISESDRDLISQICIKKQLEDRRKNLK